VTSRARGGLPVPARIPLLVLGFASLVVGIGAGLARLGVEVPDIAAADGASPWPPPRQRPGRARPNREC
jgi:hypothetical protein